MGETAKRIKCPNCQKELGCVGYTDRGTRTLREYPPSQSWQNTWEEVDVGGDCTFYCLECGCEFEFEELEEAGIL